MTTFQNQNTIEAEYQKETRVKSGCKRKSTKILNDNTKAQDKMSSNDGNEKTIKIRKTRTRSKPTKGNNMIALY